MLFTKEYLDALNLEHIPGKRAYFPNKQLIHIIYIILYMQLEELIETTSHGYCRQVIFGISFSNSLSWGHENIRILAYLREKKVNDSHFSLTF